LAEQNENIARINGVLKHIEENLDQELNLEELARVAHYSSFHFQRMFKSIVGESPKQYITRLRLEEAAHIIVLSPEKSMIEVALHSGFKSLEAFSRSFKNYYKISPDNFRRSPESVKLKTIQHPDISNKFLDVRSAGLFTSWDQPVQNSLEISIGRRPDKKVVCLQTVLANVNEIEQNFKRIKKWAEARELIGSGNEIFGMIKDYPVFTALDKCRYLTCISVTHQPDVDGLISYMEIPQATYACFQTSGDLQNIIETISEVVNNWLPDSGYRVVHEPAIQIPFNDPLCTSFLNNSYKIQIKVRPA
jgi:AraC family transcriptional regulator